jgi:hypothetical protein
MGGVQRFGEKWALRRTIERSCRSGVPYSNLKRLRLLGSIANETARRTHDLGATGFEPKIPGRINASCRTLAGRDISAFWKLRASAHRYRNAYRNDNVTRVSSTAKSLINGAPEEIRTPDPQIRSLVLYPAELRARFRLMFAGSRARRHFRNWIGKVAKERFSYPLRSQLARSATRYLPNDLLR